MISLKALILEDDEADVELLLRGLEKSGFSVTHKRVLNAADLSRALEQESWDIVLSDLNMPGFDALHALQIVQNAKLDIPFLVVSGAIGEETAVEVMKAGADDYIMKSKLTRLAPSIERSLREVATRKRDHESRNAVAIAVRDRENMLAIVSHDLKNPLGAIQLNHQLMARTLQQEKEPDERDRKLLSQLARAQRSTIRMVNLIDDILDIAKIESGRFVIEKSESRVDELFSEVLELHQPHAIQKSILLTTKLPDPSCIGYFDHARIFQVLSNLIGNAIKFSSEGGSVTVKAELRSGELVFAVQDSGSGIAIEHIPHIFDRFYQARETARLGTGLGLSIAKGIVDAHQGKIWAESALGVGTTFYFALPAKECV